MFSRSVLLPLCSLDQSYCHYVLSICLTATMFSRSILLSLRSLDKSYGQCYYVLLISLTGSYCHNILSISLIANLTSYFLSVYLASTVTTLSNSHPR